MLIQTAVMILPPPEVQAVAIPIIKRYGSRMLQRFPAHLTVHFPFVDFELLHEGIPTLRAIYADVRQFEITVSGFGTFPKVTFMSPTEPDRLLAIFQKSYAAFPDAPPYGGVFGNTPHPHISVGFFNSEEEQATADLPDYDPITFRVDRFHVLYGTFDPETTAPWITEAIVPLGST